MDSKSFSLKEIEAKPELIHPNWLEIIETLNQDVSKEWDEGPSGKIDGTKDSSFKSYIKKLDSGILVRSEAVIEGINIDKFVKALSELRPEWDDRIKKNEVLLEFPEGKIVYSVLNTPFPMSDRDAVIKLFRISNKGHPELVKKYGLPVTDHKYYLILDEAVEITEHPKKKGKERATLNSFYFIEEIADKKDCFKIRTSMRNDLGGSIPDMIMNSMAKKMPKKIFCDLVEALPKLEKKGLV